MIPATLPVEHPPGVGQGGVRTPPVKEMNRTGFIGMSIPGIPKKPVKKIFVILWGLLYSFLFVVYAGRCPRTSDKMNFAAPEGLPAGDSGDYAVFP